MPTRFERRQILVGAGALAVAGAAFASSPHNRRLDFTRSALDQLVPSTAGSWTGAADPDVVPEGVDGSIDGGRTLTRLYRAAGLPPVMLVVSYHGPDTPELKVHRPETCYAAAGFSGGRPEPILVSLPRGAAIPAVTFTARRAERVETVLYWTRIGDRFPQDLQAQRLALLREALRGVLADGLLMRASLVGSEPGASLRTLKAFAATLVASASSEGRVLLLGRAALPAA